MSETTGPFVEPHREVRHKQIAAGKARAAVFRRSYDAPIEDVWEACTNPDRLRRWFLPVTGDLHLGGAFNLGGFLDCEVLRCEPPRLLTFSQAYEDLPVDEIELRLFLGDDGATVVELAHATVSQTFEWDGRLVDALSLTGTGWEPGLVALELFLGDALPDDFDMDAFRAQPEIAAIAERARETWGVLADAAAGAGTGAGTGAGEGGDDA